MLALKMNTDLNNYELIYADKLYVQNEYFTIFIFLIFSIVLTFILIFFSYKLAKQNPDSEKLSAYECGFEPYDDARHTFDVKFLVIAIIFILFDIESIFLMPWCVSLAKLDCLGFWSMIDFLFELGVGFFYIWYTSSINWK